MKTTTISEAEYNRLKQLHAEFEAWRGGRCSYHTNDVPEKLRAMDNDARSKIEFYEFVHNPPDRYFLYIDAKKGTHYGASGTANIWTGVKLGDVQFGNTWRDNMGATRVSISVYAVNGYTYHGTYFKSSGDYARVKMSSKSKKRLQRLQEEQTAEWAAKGGVK